MSEDGISRLKMSVHNRKSLYWDDFERRINETVEALKSNTNPPVRRVAVFITNKCNLKCGYCNHNLELKTLSESKFCDVIEKYGKTANTKKERRISRLDFFVSLRAGR